MNSTTKTGGDGAAATPRVAVLIALGGLLTMASCVPESDLTAAIGGGAAYGEGRKGDLAGLPEPGNWWKAFDDGGLDALLERLRRENPGLKASQARYDQARAALGLARADQFPRIFGDGSAMRMRDSAGGIFVPPDLTYDDYRAALNLSYEIDLWGRVRQSVDAARAEMEASAADLAGAQVSLEAELARTWYQWRFVGEEARVLGRTIELREENLKLVEARVRGGETNELDRERARAELETTRAQLFQVERARAELVHALAVLAGEAPATFQPPKSQGVGKAAVIPAGVPSDLLARRPDIASAERRLAAAGSRVGAAKASYLPKVTLTGVGGSSTLDSSQFFDFDSLFGQIGPQVQVPIFQGGKLVDEVKKADAEAREALASYEEVVLVAFREVEDALSGIRFLDREIAAHQKALDAARTAAILSRRRYEGGLVSYLEVVDAERTALSEERELTRARSARHLASVQLIRALGGGWQRP